MWICSFTSQIWLRSAPPPDSCQRTLDPNTSCRQPGSLMGPKRSCYNSDSVYRGIVWMLELGDLIRSVVGLLAPTQTTVTNRTMRWLSFETLRAPGFRSANNWRFLRCNDVRSSIFKGSCPCSLVSNMTASDHRDECSNYLSSLSALWFWGWEAKTYCAF